MTKIYVGNLPYSTTAEKLSDLFSKLGNVVDVKIIIDKFTGRSKGFGFVEMSSEDEANNAISTLNGTEFEGRTLKVDKATNNKSSNNHNKK